MHDFVPVPARPWRGPSSPTHPADLGGRRPQCDRRRPGRRRADVRPVRHPGRRVPAGARHAREGVPGGRRDVGTARVHRGGRRAGGDPVRPRRLPDRRRCAGQRGQPAGRGLGRSAPGLPGRPHRLRRRAVRPAVRRDRRPGLPAARGHRRRHQRVGGRPDGAGRRPTHRGSRGRPRGAGGRGSPGGGDRVAGGVRLGDRHGTADRPGPCGPGHQPGPDHARRRRGRRELGRPHPRRHDRPRGWYRLRADSSSPATARTCGRG